MKKNSEEFAIHKHLLHSISCFVFKSQLFSEKKPPEEGFYPRKESVERNDDNLLNRNLVSVGFH